MEFGDRVRIVTSGASPWRRVSNLTHAIPDQKQRIQAAHLAEKLLLIMASRRRRTKGRGMDTGRDHNHTAFGTFRESREEPRKDRTPNLFRNSRLLPTVRTIDQNYCIKFSALRDPGGHWHQGWWSERLRMGNLLLETH